MKMYKVSQDGIYTSIETVEADFSGLSKQDIERYYGDCHKNFTDAKKEAVEYLRYMKNQYAYALSEMQALRAKK